jgi:hypothetical protein
MRDILFALFLCVCVLTIAIGVAHVGLWLGQ